jgi:hypothetical protein
VLCEKFATNGGWCPFGPCCLFAHGAAELRLPGVGPTPAEVLASGGRHTLSAQAAEWWAAAKAAGAARPRPSATPTPGVPRGGVSTTTGNASMARTSSSFAAGAATYRTPDARPRQLPPASAWGEARCGAISVANKVTVATAAAAAADPAATAAAAAVASAAAAAADSAAGRGRDVACKPDPDEHSSHGAKPTTKELSQLFESMPADVQAELRAAAASLGVDGEGGHEQRWSCDGSSALEISSHQEHSAAGHLVHDECCEEEEDRPALSDDEDEGSEGEDAFHAGCEGPMGGGHKPVHDTSQNALHAHALAGDAAHHAQLQHGSGAQFEPPRTASLKLVAGAKLRFGGGNINGGGPGGGSYHSWGIDAPPTFVRPPHGGAVAHRGCEHVADMHVESRLVGHAADRAASVDDVRGPTGIATHGPDHPLHPDHFPPLSATNKSVGGSCKAALANPGGAGDSTGGSRAATTPIPTAPMATTTVGDALVHGCAAVVGGVPTATVHCGPSPVPAVAHSCGQHDGNSSECSSRSGVVAAALTSLSAGGGLLVSGRGSSSSSAAGLCTTAGGALAHHTAPPHCNPPPGFGNADGHRMTSSLLSGNMSRHAHTSRQVYGNTVRLHASVARSPNSSGSVGGCDQEYLLLPRDGHYPQSSYPAATQYSPPYAVVPPSLGVPPPSLLLPGMFRYKAVLCTFHADGNRCRNGSACAFAHG